MTLIPDFVFNLMAEWKRKTEVVDDLGAVEGNWTLTKIKDVRCFKADESGGKWEDRKGDFNRKQSTVFVDFDTFLEGDVLTINAEDFEITSVRNPATMNNHLEMTVKKFEGGNI